MLNGIEDILDAVVLFGLAPFEMLEAAGEVFVGGEKFAQADEGSDDGEADVYCEIASEDGSKHHDAVFGEDEWGITASAARRL
jgi:hypothetical protein